MKILHVTQGYFPALGGTELLVQRISEELSQQFGDDVTVFTTNCYHGGAFYTPGLPTMPTGWEEINGVHVRRFPVDSRLSRLFYPFRPTLRKLRFPGNQYFRTLYNGPIVHGLAKAINEQDFDIVAASSFPLLHMFITLNAAHHSKRPCVFYGGLHPHDEWGFQRPIIYKAIQQADYYIAYTEYEAQYVIQRGAHPQKVAAIGVGVDMQPFTLTNTVEARCRLGIPENVPVIGFIGQVGAHKGVDTLIRAMPLVWQVIPDAILLISGAKTLFAPQLDQWFSQLSTQEKTKIILKYDFSSEEKPWLFAALDVFAYPSGFESFGIAFLEAWSAQKPVIGCKRGAIPWVVNAGRDGLLVNYQDERMLAEAIISLINNPQWARHLGSNGYHKVAKYYTWPEIARKFRQVYIQSISMKP